MRDLDFKSSPTTIIQCKSLERWDAIVQSVVAPRKTRIYWSVYEPRNFGDWITPYLYSKITGETPYYQKPMFGIEVVFGAGSIMRHVRERHSAIIWGSGVISRRDNFSRPKEVLSVRGKYTRAYLEDRQIACPAAYGDPGILLPQVYVPQNTCKKYALGIVPHFFELAHINNDSEILQSPEVRIIDPTNPIEQVISEIVECEATVSSSLHGLIVSHAYGIQSGWIHLFPKKTVLEGDGIKFIDYFSSVGLEEYAKQLDVDQKDAGLIEALLIHAENTPLPDQVKLRDGLMSTCPF